MMTDCARVLFEGGWRSQDIGDLALDLDLEDWEARELCRELREIGLKNRLEADILDARAKYAVVRQDRDGFEPGKCWFFEEGGRAMDEAFGIWEGMSDFARRTETVCVREIREEEFEDGVWEPRTGRILWTCGGKTGEGLRFETENPYL